MMKTMAKKIVINFHRNNNLSSYLSFIFLICSYSTTEALTDSYKVLGIAYYNQFSRYITI